MANEGPISCLQCWRENSVRKQTSKLHEIFTADNQGVCILSTISHRMQ